MTRDERLALERLYNLVRPARLVVDPRHDQGWQAIAIFEEEIKGSEEQAGLRVQAATVHPNDARLNALHPENEKQYHLAQLICAAVNALPELLRGVDDAGGGPRWDSRKEWRCPVCRCGGVRGTEDMHDSKCHGLPHDPSCSAFFASDPLTGESLCNCGRIRP